MINLYGSSGLGAAGTGVQPGGMAPGSSAMSPQLMAMLQALQGGQQQTGAPAIASPMGQPGATPMAGYIGTNGGGPNVQAPMMAPQQQAAPQQQGIGQALGALPGQIMSGAQNALQMQALMQKLKGGQTGLPASGAQSAAPLGSLAPQAQPNGTMSVPMLPAQAASSGNGSALASLFSRLFGGGGS